MTSEMAEISQGEITEDRFNDGFNKIKHVNKIAYFVFR